MCTSTHSSTHIVHKESPHQHLEIRWFSIFNSIVTVLLLTGFLATILLRILKNDFTRYARVEEVCLLCSRAHACVTPPPFECNTHTHTHTQLLLLLLLLLLGVRVGARGNRLEACEWRCLSLSRQQGAAVCRARQRDSAPMHVLWRPLPRVFGALHAVQSRGAACGGAAHLCIHIGRQRLCGGQPLHQGLPQ